MANNLATRKVRSAIGVAKWVLWKLFPMTMVDRDVRCACGMEREAAILSDLVKPGQSVIDVGANWGFYSRLCERLVGSENVYSIEPGAWAAAMLLRWRKADRVFKLALSDKCGSAMLRLPIVNGSEMNTRATLESGFTEQGSSGTREEVVHLSTLDQFVVEQAIRRVGFVKIDVEGHEMAVIRGGTATLTRDKPNLLVEIEQRHHREPISKVFGAIEELGFSGHFLDANEQRLRDLREFRAEEHQSCEGRYYVQNFIFTERGTRPSYGVLPHD